MSGPIPGLSRRQVARMAALDGVDVPGEATSCPHPCTSPACDLEPGQCHERHAGDAWVYRPEACERERARG